MKRFVWPALWLCACTTASSPSAPSTEDAASTEDPAASSDDTAPTRDPLELRVAGVAHGFLGVQAPASRTPPPGAGAPWDTGGDSGWDSGSTEPVEACLEGDVTALQGSAVVSGEGAVAWFVVPPVFDLSFSEGETGYVARPVTVVSVTADACTIHTELPDAASEQFSTGFGSTIDGMAVRFIAPAGLMVRLLDQGDDLWLFSNNSTAWWTIDAADGSVSEQAALDAPVAGAVSDGAGGAWVSLLPQLPWPEGSGTAVAAQVQALDDTGTPTGVAWTLPFDPATTGFGRLAEDPPVYDTGSFTTTLTPHFLSNDLARDVDGLLWVLDSESATLARVDPADGSSTTFALPIVYPTGIAYEDEQLVVTSGLEADRATDAIVSSPALHSVSTTDGTVTASVTLPEPADGWDITRGFVSLSSSASSTQGIYRDGWLGLAGTGSGALMVSDPKGGQLVVVE